MKATRAYIDGLVTGLAHDTKITFKEGKGWSVDVKTETLTYNPASLTQYDSEIVKGLIIHETGHILETTVTKPTDVQKKYPFMQHVYNALEDIRIEDRQCKRFGNWSSQALAFLNATFIETLTNNPAGDTPQETILNAMSQIIIYSLYYSQQENHFNFSELHNKNHHRLSDESTSIYDQIIRTGIKDHVINAKTTDEVKKIADRDIFPLIEDLLKQIPPDQQTKPDENQGEGKMSHTDSTKTKKDFVSTLPSDEELDQLLNPYAVTLSNKLLNVLIELRSKRFTGLHKTGKLLSKNAYKVLTDETRIFSKKINPNVPDYNIILCLDDSGSMDGSRYHHAYIAAYLLVKTCKKLDFPIHLVRFGNEVDTIDSLKPYRRFGNCGHNEDAGALREAQKHIDPKRQNIIFMMSDGDICTQVAPEVIKIRKTGTQLIGIGVGITGNELQRHYGDAVNVPEVEKLPMALINVLKRIIHR